MLFPLLYKEVELLAPAIGDWRLSTAIPAWESALFAGQPSLYLSERLAFVPLSEYLHFSYLSYVIVIPSVAAYWYVSGRRAAFGELLLMLSTVLLGSYLFFILLPVDSPYYLSQRLGPPLSGHFFFDLVHQVSARGGARGGAFPSAHASGAVVVILVAWRHQRRLAYLLVPISGGLLFATVYGRFHYVLDTLAGAGLAIAVVVAYRRGATADDVPCEARRWKKSGDELSLCGRVAAPPRAGGLPRSSRTPRRRSGGLDQPSARPTAIARLRSPP